MTSGLRRGSGLDNVLTVMSVAGDAVAQFWLGLMLIVLFSVEFHQRRLPFLPCRAPRCSCSGFDQLDRLVHLVMPAIVLVDDSCRGLLSASGMDRNGWGLRAPAAA